MKLDYVMRTVLEFWLAVPKTPFDRISSHRAGRSPLGARCVNGKYQNWLPKLSSRYVRHDVARCIARAEGHHDEPIEVSKIEPIQNWLVVGDGDLSYSATIANDLARKNIRLYATVLEEEEIHNSVYQRSSQNKEAISVGRADVMSPRLEHKVLFGIDATRLKDFFPSTNFHTIEFNFPHWRGKTNAKRNRQLVDDFIGSASEVLHEDGQIVISLCEGQGGFPATTVEQWKQSWLVPKYAAERGLLLRKLQIYEPLYQQTSHRGRDRPWLKDGTAQRYTFTFPNEVPIQEDLQISCRHELRIVIPKSFDGNEETTREDILEGDAVFNLTKEFVPEGIRMEVVTREILDPYVFDDEKVTLAIFLLNYSGASVPLTRDGADGVRSKLETTVQERWSLKIAKAGRLVSLPYPTHLLPFLIRESSERSAEVVNGQSLLGTTT